MMEEVMAKILIADRSKAGLVMSTEVFKEKVPGTAITVAKDGNEFLRLLPELNPDIGIVDFDLPDVDGTTLVRYARDIYEGPILLTAYGDERTREIIRKELFAFEDAVTCVEKPIKSEKLSAVIDRFLISKKRVLKRFETDGDLVLTTPKEGNNTTGIRVKGKLINISLGGVCLHFGQNKMSSHVGNSVTVAMSMTEGKRKTKMKGRLCWVDAERKVAGVKFSHLSDTQKGLLENSLRVSAGLCES